MDDNNEAPTPYPNLNIQSQALLESKKYKFKLEEDSYSLLMEITSDNSIKFSLINIKNISLYNYINEYTYDRITDLFILHKEHYKDINKVFQFFDKAITNDKIKLNYDKNNHKMILSLKRIVDFDEIESKLILNENKIPNDDMINYLIKEMNKIKNENKEKEKKNEEIIKELKEKNIENENKTKNLEEKIKILEDEINKYKDIINKKENLNNKIKNILKEKLKEQYEDMQNKIKEQFDLILKKDNNFKDNIKEKEEIKEVFKNEEKKLIEEEEEEEDEENIYIKKVINKKVKEEKKDEENIINDIDIKINLNNQKQLKFKYNLTKNIENNANMSNFEVFIGLKDNIEYIIYSNKTNYNLDIMTITDQKIIRSLKGHNSVTSVIKYFKKESKDYILSCDDNKLVIIWDIQNNYNKKYTFYSKYKGFISDGLLLFNINKNDYIILSSNKENEYSTVYEFSNNAPLIKKIYETNKNETYYMIYWLYKNKHYIIECCKKKISINNLLKNENYANLSIEPESYYYSGFIYKDDYLCVNDFENNLLRIWDLVNKIIYKQIQIEANFGREIISWDDKYAIIGCKGCLVIVNIDEEETVEKIDINNIEGEFYKIKKIKTNKLGDCVIGSIFNNSICLFSS